MLPRMSNLLPSEVAEAPGSGQVADLVKIIRLIDQALAVFRRSEGGRQSALDLRARSMMSAVREELMAEVEELHGQRKLQAANGRS